MKNNFLKYLFDKLQSFLPAHIIAAQLRQPSGFLASVIGKKMNESNEFLYDLVIETMKLQTDEKILEIGFGNGKFFERIFAKAKGLNLNGIDFSVEMVKTATKVNQHRIKTGELNLQPGNSDNLPFADKSFDKVFCINVIYFWENPQAHLGEIRRVLKENGKFYCGIKSKESMQKMFFTKQGFNLYTTFTKQGFNLYTTEELAEMFQKTGFTGIQVNKELRPKNKVGEEDFEAESLCLVTEKIK